MRLVAVGLMLRPEEVPADVVFRMKKKDAWDPDQKRAVPTVHHKGFRFIPSTRRDWLGRVEWEADVP